MGLSADDMPLSPLALPFAFGKDDDEATAAAADAFVDDSNGGNVGRADNVDDDDDVFNSTTEPVRNA